jgi:hypothetical protein
MKVLVGPGSGDAEGVGDRSASLAEAGFHGGFAVWSGIRLRPVHTLPDGTVTPDAALA